jgi:hypothetical protein
MTAVPVRGREARPCDRSCRRAVTSSASRGQVLDRRMVPGGYTDARGSRMSESSPTYLPHISSNTSQRGVCNAQNSTSNRYMPASTVLHGEKNIENPVRVRQGVCLCARRCFSVCWNRRSTKGMGVCVDIVGECVWSIRVPFRRRPSSTYTRLPPPMTAPDRKVRLPQTTKSSLSVRTTGGALPMLPSLNKVGTPKQASTLKNTPRGQCAEHNKTRRARQPQTTLPSPRLHCIVYGTTKGFVSYGGFTHVGFPLRTSVSPPTLYPSSLQLPLSPLSLPLPSRRSRVPASAVVL